MGTNGSTEVNMLTGKDTEGSDSTVEIKIKTLDSQTYTLRVNRCVPVPALKEKIASVTGVLSEQQRLICRGKVLKDNELLSAYHVEDGHTLHLVVRQPVHSGSPSTSSERIENATGHPDSNTAPVDDPGRGIPASHNVVLEAINIGNGDHPPGLAQLITGLLSSIGVLGTGIETARSQIRGSNSEGNQRSSSDSSILDSIHSQPSPTAPGVNFGSQQTSFRFPTAAHLGSQRPLVIPDSLTTISEYLGFMREELTSEGFIPSDSHAPLSSRQGGLPGPATLAEILSASRNLLIDQAGGLLSQLATLLESQSSVTDPAIRMNIQSTALRSGVLLQNLGPLLLELGRTTMTLQTGQMPSEAVINAGPAVFISSTGPNPMMVQPAFYPGFNFNRTPAGPVSSLSGHEGHALRSSFPPRHIEIQIHAGPMPVPAANLGGQVGSQQAQEQTDTSRSSAGTNFVRHAFSGLSGDIAPSGESGFRVVPIRTVVAVPARMNQSSSDSSANGIGVLYPLLTRVQQPNSAPLNGARGSQASANPLSGVPGSDRHSVPESSMQRQSIERSSRDPASSSPVASGMSHPENGAQHQGPAVPCISGQQGSPGANTEDSTQASSGQRIGEGSVGRVFSSFDHLIGTLRADEHNASGSGQNNTAGTAAVQIDTSRQADQQDTPVVTNDQGVLFSNLVRQVMPYISQGTGSHLADAPPTNTASSTSQAEGQDFPDSFSSPHRRDPPEYPDSKRPKRE